MQGLWARIIIRYQLSVMWSHSPLSSCAPQQQQHRWRCVSLSFSSTVMQEWCFKTVFREKKSQTPTPSCLTEPHCHPMRKNQHKSFTLHIPDEDEDDSIIFISTPLPAFLPIGLYITTHFALLLLFLHSYIATICNMHLVTHFGFLRWTLFFY